MNTLAWISNNRPLARASWQAVPEGTTSRRRGLLVGLFLVLFVAMTSAKSADMCFPNLPAPIIRQSDTMEYSVNGQLIIRYRLPVTNWSDFPDELFRVAPDLPPCGLNPDASRSWVTVYSSSGGQASYGFCGFEVSSHLTNCWLGVAFSQTPPTTVYVEINDRLCGLKYRSPDIVLTHPNRVDGRVAFLNRGISFPTAAERRVFGPDCQPLTGTNYLAQLYYLPGADRLDMASGGLAVTNSPMRFWLGAVPGYWNVTFFPTEDSGYRILFGTRPGQTATLQVRVWDETRGATYEQAATNAGFHVASAAFNYLVPSPSADVSSFAMDGFRGIPCPVVSVPPTITSQPQSKSVSYGTNVTFTVVASGTDPLRYQWFFNRTLALLGATNSSLVVTALPPRVGNYTVVVTNAFGSVTSLVAALNVIPPGLVWRQGFEGLAAGTLPDGWSVDGQVIWEIGHPTSGPGAAYSGDTVAATILAGNYPPNGSSRLVTAPFVLPIPSAGERLEFQYWEWFCYENSDQARAQVSVYNPTIQQWTGWIDLTTLWGPVSSGQWMRRTVDLSQYAGWQIRLGFLHEGQSPTECAGWYLDELQVAKVQPLPAADFSEPTIHAQNFELLGSANFGYNTTYGGVWSFFAINGYFRARFWLDSVEGFALQMIHLSSLMAGAAGDGYSPIDVVLNDTDGNIYNENNLLLDNYDTAQNHGGAHALERDVFAIPSSMLRYGWNELSLFIEDSPRANSQYWIQSLKVLGPLPDLVISNVVVSGNAAPGQPVQISWTVHNRGTALAEGPWEDAVYLSTDATIEADEWLASFVHTNTLLPGQSLTFTRTVILPSGQDGAYFVAINADASLVIAESSDLNNTGVSSSPALLRGPDLRVGEIVTPSTARFGDSLSARWAITNAGTGPAEAGWTDGTYLSTNTDLSGVVLRFDPIPATDVIPLSAGNAYVRTQLVQLPLLGSLRPGTYYFLVATDEARTQTEVNETNNLRASGPFNLTWPPLPDLTATNLVTPSVAQPGECYDVTWVTTNRGSAPLSGVWSETIFSLGSPFLSNAVPVAQITVTNDLPAGGFLFRTQRICFPVTGPATGPSGNVRLVVEVDSGRAIPEQEEANNIITAATPTLIQLGLMLTGGDTPVSEDATAPAAVLTVSRNGPRANALVVTLSGSDSSELTLPTSVVVPANQVSVSLNVTSVWDHVVDGPQTVFIRATAPNFLPATNTMTVLDADVPRLFLELASASLLEGQTTTGKVTREFYRQGELTVLLGGSVALEFPSSVLIPDGQSNATFIVTARNNDLVERSRTVELNTAAPGYEATSRLITITDDDVPALTLSVQNTNISEASGSFATVGTLRRATPGALPLVVALESSDATEAVVPRTITLEAGQTVGSFAIGAVNDGVLDGTQLVTLRAFPTETLTGERLSLGAVATIEVSDDQGLSLQARLTRSVLLEGDTTTLTVLRSGPTNQPLNLGLNSSNPGKVTLAPNATLLPGQTSVVVNVTTFHDGVANGAQPVVLRATAPGYASGSDTLMVTDLSLPDLVVSEIAMTNLAEAGGEFNVRYRVLNQGPGPATNAIRQRVWLSTDPFLGDDLVLGEAIFRTEIVPENHFDQVLRLTLPQQVGDYWILVSADVRDEVMEVNEENNVAVSTHPLRVEAAYVATVEADVDVAPAGTSVSLSGRATLVGSAEPAALKPVDIHILVQGTERLLSVHTATNGQFHATFEPLPGEAGIYTVFAARPGVSGLPAQDSFILLGLTSVPAQVAHVLPGLGNVTNELSLLNLGDVGLTGLNAQVANVPGGLAVSLLAAPTQIASSGSAPLRYTIRSLSDTALRATVLVRISSPAGVNLEVPVDVRVEPLRPRLVAVPGSLYVGMLRGRQTLVELEVRNEGGKESGLLSVLLPQASWLTLASTNPVPSVPPGGSTRLTVQLLPPAELGLGLYDGSMVIDGENVAPLSVPFHFNCISEAVGDLKVSVLDEFTYFAEGAPKVANATVTVIDAASGTNVATVITGPSGEVLLPRLVEAWYRVEVRANNHGDFHGTILLPPGRTLELDAFISRRTVSYTWVVTPTEIEDRYVFHLEATFEAHVPIPVVVVEPASLDLERLTNEVTQIDFTVSNHGLVAARGAELTFASHPNWELVPLVRELGELPPLSSRVVPVTVRRKNPAGQGETGPCEVEAHLDWFFPCGPDNRYYRVPIVVFNASSACRYTPPAPPPFHPPAGGAPFIAPGRPDYFFSPPGTPVAVCEEGCSPLLPHLNLPDFVQVLDVCDPSSSGEGVCARVSLSLDQQAVLTRSAFNGTLELNNRSSVFLSNIRVELDVRDANGRSATNLFGIGLREVTRLGSINGGALSAGQVGRAVWTFVPSPEAAPAEPTVYTVGGKLRYTQEGRNVTVTLFPARVVVWPQPRLVMDYFLERDVYADDPFTVPLEPSQPFALGLRVLNSGGGSARNLNITTSQPVIINNAKNLLVDFRIIGSQVGAQAVTPALTVGLGDIRPGRAGVATWTLVSSLEGTFERLEASYQHIDDLGRQNLSLIETVKTHQLTHVVQAMAPGSDAVPDFLVDDIADVGGLPDTVYLSDGTAAVVNLASGASVTAIPNEGGTNLALTASFPPGWSYLRVPDPAPLGYVLARVLRTADGSELKLGPNVWTTHRIVRTAGQSPRQEDFLHLFDFESQGAYRLIYGPDPVDVLAPASHVEALPGQSYVQLPVRWSGEDNPGGSGIDFFDVFVAINDGPFAVWQARTQLRGALFLGTLGNRYTFYSRATDRAGNQEGAPGIPDALTVVSLTNRPPVLAPIPDCTTNEGALLIKQLMASDPDADVQTLTYELLDGPAGAQLDPSSGLLVWATGEAHGDSVNVITVRVCDNGLPQLCDTTNWTVFVQDVNLAPAFVPVPPVAVNVGETLSLTNEVVDADLPVQNITVGLDPNTAPAGMRVSLTNGLWVVRWTPSSAYASTTNAVRLVARDDGNPSLTATQHLVILVNDYLALGAGRTAVRAGARGRVPLTVFSSAGVVDLQWNLCHTPDWLADLDTLHKVGVTSISPIGGGCYAMSWAPLNNDALLGTVEIADLSFLAATNRSAFVPLLFSDVTALRRDGALVPRVAAVPGRVAVVGNEPMLEALVGPADSRVLQLYGIPGGRYRIDTAPTFLGPWQQSCEATLTNPTNLTQVVCEPISRSESNLFFRALQLFP